MTRNNRSIGSNANEPSTREGVTASPVSEVCGYRLIRVLQREADRTTWLATTAPGASGRANAPEERPVALTRFEHAPHEAQIPGAALSLTSPHLQCALDVATDDAGHLVVIAERTEATLADLLGIRQRMPLGEIITVVAPVASALHTLHEAGFAHGGLSPAVVGFTSEGRPLLVLIDAPAVATERDATVAELRRQDIAALRRMLAHLFERCDEGGNEPVASLLRWFDRVATLKADDAFFAQLDLRLFALANPLPISFAPDPPELRVPGSDPKSLIGSVNREDPAAGRQRHAPGWLAGLFDSTGLGALAEITDTSSLSRKLAAHATGLGGWFSRVLRGRATMLVVATGVAVAVVWGGLVVLPDTEDAVGANDGSTERRSLPELTMTEKEKAAVEADEPLAALTALLALRSRCLATGSLNCISLFAEPGSAAEATDEHALSTKGEPLIAGPIAAEETALLQHTGHAALFRVHPAGDKESQPVLVLVMKTNAGWRVRDLAVPG
ncbi:hypothetical protein [Mycetocola zhadangensis]|uniref:Protein kinase domain-containing protein n=1 Tax=Mycetocola zhadangensis TaxID=1164595 RepID=A0A3L7J9B3_9MICO|nr:hypothetical protein [Mycetocola zhadangensis]RLQ86051.1 hypothetical protein D9V28_04215 [Mycetocola zhadangensis]GGE87952.1 hypothetical protein GCM10011313_08270 [Mycetocola zhadangensis]